MTQHLPVPPCLLGVTGEPAQLLPLQTVHFVPSRSYSDSRRTCSPYHPQPKLSSYLLAHMMFLGHVISRVASSFLSLQPISFVGIPHSCGVSGSYLDNSSFFRLDCALATANLVTCLTSDGFHLCASRFVVSLEMVQLFVFLGSP